MRIIATQDESLVAQVVSCQPLLYSQGPDTLLDRPAYVRAASSLVRFGSRLVVIQDDANFLAIIDPDDLQVHSITLPAGADGKRQFDDLRNNKRFKLDLEACVTIPTDSGELLVAFGSGSSPLRERILIASNLDKSNPDVAIHDASSFYAALRQARDFAGSDMNIEGAVFLNGSIRLFGRGNGAARDDMLPLNATCDIDWSTLYTHLLNGQQTPPLPQAIVQYDIGSLDDLRLSFTDAAIGPACIIFSATAEDSPDAIRDGIVKGSVLGVLDAGNRMRWAVLRKTDGTRFTGKVEGVLLAPESPDRAYIIVDADDPRVPSELCEVELSGPWFADL